LARWPPQWPASRADALPLFFSQPCPRPGARRKTKTPNGGGEVVTVLIEDRRSKIETARRDPRPTTSSSHKMACRL
jgi:hypothetical protein